MYGDLLLERLGVKFLGPAPLHLELLHMLTTFHWNALGSTLGWWFAFLVGGLAGASRFLGTHFPSGMSLVKYNPGSECPTTCAKTGSPVERMNITLVPAGNMVVLSSSISAKVSKMSCHECKGYKWQCPTTQSRTEQHNEPQRKILLPSAVHLEERLTVSQSVPEPASRQSDRYTPFGFLVSGRCSPKQQGGPAPQYK